MNLGPEFLQSVPKKIQDFKPVSSDGLAAEQQLEFFKQRFRKHRRNVYYVEKIEGNTYKDLNRAWESNIG